MENLLTSRFLALLIIMIGFSCKKDNNEFKLLPQTLDIKVGEIKSLNFESQEGSQATTAKVKFIKIEEGRCPIEDCSTCYGGYVTAYFDISINNQSTKSLTLKRISCINAGDLTASDQTADRKESDNLLFILSNITEYSKNNSIDKNNYTAKIIFVEL